MDDTTILGGALGQLGQTAKQTVKQAVKIPEEVVKDAGGQAGSVKKEWQSDEERVKFLRDLYGKSDVPQDENLKVTEQTNSTNEKPTEFQEQIKDKSPEEQKELIELRNKLHKEVYYDPTFNPVKNPSAGGEERPAEKVEQEKKQEMQELEQKEAKKPPPLAVVRERNKAEMFRGASG